MNMKMSAFCIPKSHGETNICSGAGLTHPKSRQANDQEGRRASGHTKARDIAPLFNEQHLLATNVDARLMMMPNQARYHVSGHRCLSVNFGALKLPGQRHYENKTDLPASVAYNKW